MAVKCPVCSCQIDKIFQGQLTEYVYFEESLCTNCGSVVKQVIDHGLVASEEFYNLYRSRKDGKTKEN